MYKLAAILLLLINSIAIYSKNPPREYTAVRTQQNINVDGNLDEDSWKSAQWNDDFHMYYPYDNKKPSEETKFAIIYDEDFVYVAIKALDSDPGSITRRLTRRDNLDGDWIGIQFDSYNDLQTAYAFNVSVAGTKRDVFISDDGHSEDDSWDPIWWVETSVTSQGWEAEMKIPFSQLRFVNSYEQTWGVQIERYIHRHEEISLWNHKKRDDPGWVHHYGKMNGLVDIQPKKVFDLYPYSVGSLSTYEKEDGNPYADGSDLDGSLGLDGKIGLTNNLTLDFTVNPDFGQVEADPSSVNLSGFELFFQEKRPFFVEGNNIINYPLNFGDGNLAWENLFYSRRIGRQPHHYPDLDDNEYAKTPDFTRIIGAAKVTGRTENGLSIGILESLTAQEKSTIQNAEGETRKETAEPMTNYASASLQKDFGEGNTLFGGMFTSTNRMINDEHLNYLHDNAYSGGLNFTKYWKEKTWFVEARASFSHVTGDSVAIIETQRSSTHNFQRPDADHLTLDSSLTSLSGHAGLVSFGKTGGGKLRFVAATSFKSPGYELNDVGFVRKSDNIFNLLWVGYRINEPFSIFKSLNVNFNNWSTVDYGGLFQGIGGNMNAFMTFKNSFGLGTGFNINSESIETSELRGGPAYKVPGNTSQWIWLGSDSRKKVRLTLFTSHAGGFENYFYRNSIEASLSVKPSNNVLIRLTPNYRVMKNHQQYVAEADYGNQQRYIMGTINQKTISASLRVNWNLTPDLSIQYWGQPFFATGEYSNFKYVTDACNNEYNDRFVEYATGSQGQVWYNENDEVYEIDENLNGDTDYSFDIPDFNTKVFLHNFVFRWEYMPGSVLFLVWSQNRNDFTTDAGVPFSDNVNDMFDFKPHDTFLVKLSYRIGI